MPYSLIYTRKNKPQTDTVSTLSMPDDVTCVVCQENRRDILFQPCNHLCMCKDCVVQAQRMLPAYQNAKCPLCRAEIRHKISVFM